MLVLFFIIAGSLALMLITPVFLFVYLSLEPHLAKRRRLHAAAVSRREGTSKTPVHGTPGFGLKVRTPSSLRRQA